MPLNQKIIDIILNECKSIEERCDGYKEKLAEIITEIITAEMQHRVQTTTIQKDIDAKCRVAGDFLAGNRDLTKMAKGDIQ